MRAGLFVLQCNISDTFASIKFCIKFVYKLTLSNILYLGVSCSINSQCCVNINFLEFMFTFLFNINILSINLSLGLYYIVKKYLLLIMIYNSIKKIVYTIFWITFFHTSKMYFLCKIMSNSLLPFRVYTAFLTSIKF